VIYTITVAGTGVAPMRLTESTERMLGYTAEETKGYDWWLECLHPEDRDRAAATLARGMAAEGYVMEYRLRHKNGTWLWIEDRNRVVRDADGQPHEIVGVWTDISARKKAETALRESEERFRQFAENINEVCWIAAADQSEILYINPNFEKIWGRTCRSLYEKPSSFFEAIHEDDRARAQAAVQAVSRGEGFDLEHRIVRPDGQIRWIHARGSAVRNEAGAVYRVAGIAEDITRRKETEQQLRQSQKMEGIGQLAGGVAHDFNNLLMIIQVNLELLLMSEEHLAAKSKEYLADIAKAADRAATLNRQLLTFSRSEAARMQTLDLNDLSEGFTKMLRRIVGEHIRVVNDFASAPPAIKGDPGMIEQVLMNLAVNARDAMPNGGRLTIGTVVEMISDEQATMDPRRRTGRFVCLSVRDNGTGIAPDHMPRIFEPFFTTKGVGKGTGLGLATVFGIAEQHHGWVEVASEVGVGTVFRVYFPMCSDGPACADQIVAQKVRGGAEKVLLVEDEKGVRDVLQQTLENYGYTVVMADSGVAAQRVWKENGGEFDLVVTDMVMPGGMTGLQLIERLRAQKPGLKALLMSGYSAELGRGVPGRTEGIAFLHKPFPMRTLAETARKCLDGN
jgi:PAS domain S-box-containing protein